MTTNILIVGNGFDLSHYLPTKYDHFMMVMQAIENWNKNKDMGFDDLFDLTHKEEGRFFQKTKEIYDTDEIKISIDQVGKLKEQLKENAWYQYFSEHVKEVKTWIDFEIKIEEALGILSNFFIEIQNVYVNKGDFKADIIFASKSGNKAYSLSPREFAILNILGMFKTNPNYGKIVNNYMKDIVAGSFSELCFIVPEDGTLGFNYSKYISNLQFELDNFIKIFNLYLEIVIDQLKAKKQFKIEVKSLVQLDQIFSFNYTNTFQSFYQQHVSTEFLHGKLGENQNIVLGIDDLNSDELKKLKAYGFTKYHQKLFKDTDYLFLDEYKKHITQLYRNLKTDTQRSPAFKRAADHSLNALEYKHRLDLTFYIWGHSLDVSDKDYIIDLFSLNDDLDRNVRVVIYYFNPNAKFALLNNLLSILGKDKVEHWMKNRWLKFEENPKIDFGITETQCSTS